MVGVNRVGYERKKKNKKTQKTQYVEDDNHPVQTNEIGNGGISGDIKENSLELSL